MVYVFVGILLVLAVYLGMRLVLLRKSIKEASVQLREINNALQENRILKLTTPDKELERLLEDVNASLQAIRMEKILFLKREQEFKQQIESISHDLRTPLTSMLGYLRIMDMSGLSEEERQDMQTVLKKAEHLQELITEFYDFSRLSTGEYGLAMEELDVAKCLRNALAAEYVDLERRGFKVSVNIPSSPLYIRADEGALKRVFQNLLQNVVRYAISILDVSVTVEAGEVILSFQNDVSGLTSREVEQLFERFYTADKARKNGSTGLGLTIAKEFVEQMKGSMEADIEGELLSIRIRFRMHK